MNNFTEEDIRCFQEVLCKYVVVSKEVGESGTPHLQGFIVMNTNHRLAAMKKLHPKAHWELCNGTTEHNINYVKKLDSEVCIERGVPPLSAAAAGAATGQLNGERWASAYASALSNEIEEIAPDLRVRYYHTWKRIRIDRPFFNEVLPELNNLWIYGPSGTGKSKYARTLGEYYVKNLNKWWCDYDDEDNVLLEEYHPDTKLNSFVKIWCDHYPFRAEYKGGSRMIRPRRIIVTSNYSIEECFSGVDLTAVSRRFKVMLKD